jgi:hypothetical protein
MFNVLTVTEGWEGAGCWIWKVKVLVGRGGGVRFSRSCDLRPGCDSKLQTSTHTRISTAETYIEYLTW